MDRDSFESYFIRAVAYQSLGKCKKAVADYKICVAMQPNGCAHILYNLGLCKAQLGDNEGAEMDFTRALELGRPIPQLYYNRALVDDTSPINFLVHSTSQ
jgi:Tfp pilus assembly protein PilF